jgi:hypothetical protein
VVLDISGRDGLRLLECEPVAIGVVESTTIRTASTPAAGNSTINPRLTPAPKLIASLPVLLDRDLAARVPLAQDLLGRVLAPAIVATTEQEPRPDEQGDPEQREQRKQQEPRTAVPSNR